MVTDSRTDRGASRFARLLRFRGTRPASLRDLFLITVGIAFIPLIVFSTAMVGLFAREERETFQQGATARTLALLTAVDTELKRSIAALEALGTSDRLIARNLGAFQAEAERVLSSRPEWLTVTLASPSGAQVMNLLRPFGTDLADAHDPPTLAEALQSQAPVVGNLFQEPLTGEHVFAVRVPILEGGRARFVLSALVTPQPIEALLSPQGLPKDWVGVVLDRNESIVARTIAGDELVGRPASESLRSALARAPEGWFRGSTLEGWLVYTPYNRSSFSGWTVAMGIPADAVESPVRRSVLYILAFGLALLALALGLAWELSRRGARSLESLAGMADRLGSGEDPDPGSGESSSFYTVAEVEALRQAFSNAARLIQARSQERDRVERSLLEVQSALRESDQRKDAFLAMLGHELRNPLAVVANAVHLLRSSETADPVTAELAEMVTRQVDHMTRMLNDLLDVSRIAQGRIQIEKHLCDLVEIVRETVDDYRETLEQSGLTLVTELPGAPQWVLGDRTRLAQALANLLHNAQKFTDAGGTIAVRLTEERGGESVLLSVRDTGVGMDRKTLDEAFQIFTQADRTIERSQGGLGLGLALVRELVRLHGGEVLASSEGVGHGSEFTIRLPLQPATLPATLPPEPSAEPVRRRRILVVEDNLMAARTLEIFLLDAGHTVAKAHSGPDAIETASSFHPEVVLCDIGLPGSSGYDVARALRQSLELRDACLIAITGYGQDADRERARAAGFDCHLTKPVNLDELRRILGDLPVPAS